MNIDNTNGIYLGIVVQNNDPDKRGRVKIYIPQLAPTINELNTKNMDRLFVNIDQTNNPSIHGALEDLKKILPWAEYAGPIFAGNATGRYNNTTKQATTSDSNAWKNGSVVDGFRPTNNFVDDGTFPDVYTSTNENGNRFTNPFAFQYTPSNYSNLARGVFSIPNVGSHVYVFFINNDRNTPVYFASAYSESDIKRIFSTSDNPDINSSVDYPATYENIDTKTTDNSDTRTFRSKSVINSNKHTIEMIDTDLREILKFTHYSGSFKEFTNNVTIEFATKNDQKMVLGDQFLTVKKNKSDFTGRHNEIIVGGDRFTTIGLSKYQTVLEILNLHKSIHEYKLLFDVQRAKYDEQPPNKMSPKQERKFITHQPCPVCGGLPYNPYDPAYGQALNQMWLEAPELPETCLITGEFTDYGAEVTDYGAEDDSAFQGMLEPIITPGMQSYAGCPSDLCKLDIHPKTGQIGVYMGMNCPCCNNVVTSLAGVSVGFSPSTEGSVFVPEPSKLPGGKLDQLIQENTPIILNLEKQLGLGGDEIVNVSMSKIETIGLVMNDMQSYRVDPIGRLKIDGCWVAPQGTFDNYRPTPHVEYVDVADIPGGDYILTVMNKYKLLVGANGINIETHGPLDIYGTIANIAAEQLNITSQNEILIDGGERASIRARKITFIPVEHNAVAVEGQLHVTRNTIIEGGLFVEGEVGLLHVTAPTELQETGIGIYNPASLCEEFPAMIDGVPCKITIPRHTHYFKNIPITFMPHKEGTRDAMIQKGINSRIRTVASAIAQNPQACPADMIEAVGEKFKEKAIEEFGKIPELVEDFSGDFNINIQAHTPSCTPLSIGTATKISITYTLNKYICIVTGTVDEKYDIEDLTATEPILMP